jgi:glycerol-3-phosphate O-acyltransferase 3/4
MLNDAASVLVEDEFTNCFQSMQSRPWNWNIYLFPAWIMGILIRYVILVPLRILCLLFGTMVVAFLMTATWLIKDSKKRQHAQARIIQFYSQVFIASWSGVIRYHGVRPQRRPNQVFVANHTTVFDIVILMQDFPFSIVGQKHPGLIGFVQDHVLSCLDCLWFDRKDADDRTKIAKLIKEHVHNSNKLPLLLFPEGTCVNNEYCVMFKKGAFEIENTTVWPIAIKYK